MLIGSEFSHSNRRLLQAIARLSGDEAGTRIPVKSVNEMVGMDRTEIKNRLEYLEERGLIRIKTIGGPLLYGHITITAEGLRKAGET